MGKKQCRRLARRVDALEAEISELRMVLVVAGAALSIGQDRLAAAPSTAAR